MELYAILKDFIVPYLEAIENATTDERTAAFTKFGDEPLASIISRNEGSNEATIKITGPLSPAGPSPLARFFGFDGTGYIDIISAAKTLENDPTIDKVRLAMDTVGGTVAGMDQARQAIKNLAVKKSVIAENHGVIASAGYYLATAAHRIEAITPLAQTGSIGIVVAGIDISDALAREGIKKIKIVSKNAPHKNPDPATPQGRDVIQDEIDATERVFINKIAEGRNTTETDVIENFGRGGMLIAQDPDPEKPDAIKVGMIDSVVISTNEVDINSENENNSVTVDSNASNGDDITSKSQVAKGGENSEETIMDLKALEKEHPALYAQVIAMGTDIGIKTGITQERERTEAHLTMGKSYNAMDLAVKYVTEGTEHSALTNAKYLTAAADAKAIADRKAETEDNLDTDNDADTSKGESPELVKATAEALGVDTDA